MAFGALCLTTVVAMAVAGTPTGNAQQDSAKPAARNPVVQIATVQRSGLQFAVSRPFAGRVSAHKSDTGLPEAHRPAYLIPAVASGRPDTGTTMVW